MSINKIRALISFLAIATALTAPAAASAACADQDLRPTSENLERVRTAIVCLHNEERKAAGVAPLRANALLNTSASTHAADMVARRFLAYETPDGLDAFDRIESAGYIRSGDHWNAGENIGWGAGALATPRSIVDGWMKSYGRRLTLIASDFDEVGVGISLGAPAAEYAGRTDAVTYTVDFGWREQTFRREQTSRRALSSCLRRASRRSTRQARQSARARCTAARAS